MKEIMKALHNIKLVFRIGFLVVILLIASADSLENLFRRMDHGYNYNNSSMEWYVSQQNYLEMANRRRELLMHGGDEVDKQEPLCAVAEYFEAASLYHVYEETGDTMRADIQWKRMEDAADRMGEYSGEREEIDAKLGIGRR